MPTSLAVNAEKSKRQKQRNAAPRSTGAIQHPLPAGAGEATQIDEEGFAFTGGKQLLDEALDIAGLGMAAPGGVVFKRDQGEERAFAFFAENQVEGARFA